MTREGTSATKRMPSSRRSDSAWQYLAMKHLHALGAGVAAGDRRAAEACAAGDDHNDRARRQRCLQRLAAEQEGHLGVDLPIHAEFGPGELGYRANRRGGAAADHQQVRPRLAEDLPRRVFRGRVQRQRLDARRGLRELGQAARLPGDGQDLARPRPKRAERSRGRRRGLRPARPRACPAATRSPTAWFRSPSDIAVVVETAGGGKLIDPAKTFWVWAAAPKQAAARASVQIDLDVDLVGGQVRVPRTPGRLRVDPRIGGRGRQEIDLHGQVDDRLAVARGPDALGRKRDPISVIGFDRRLGARAPGGRPDAPADSRRRAWRPPRGL